MAVTHLHNLSGGVLGGDQLQLEVNVGPQAQAQVTTTGATRVYRHRPGPDARQQTVLRVGPDALLEFLPDPLIPFAGARYQQQVAIELAQGSGLFYWDMIAPGREASGEVFAYARVELGLELCADGAPVALERMVLEPMLRPLESPLRWGRYRYLATLYICRVGMAAGTWSALEKELDALAQAATCPDATLWGVSTLAAHGLVVRGLGVNGRHLLAGLTTFWRAAKQLLYGRAAHPPRKLL
jgi:urease accessory protein